MSNITNEITLLFKTRLDEKSKTEIGKNLKGLLENAVITFDEAEIKKSLQPIVQMMKTMFDKAGMAFDADKLLGMPSKQALQSMANLSVKDLQIAYDKAVANSGGVKIDFGNMDLSVLSNTLDGIAADVEAVNQKMANSTKKSTSEIEASINRLKPSTKVMVDGVEQAGGKLEKTVSHIEKTLERVNKPSHMYNENSATKALEAAREKYINSVTKNDPWEVQYQHMLSFVSKYEAMSQKIKPIIDTNRPEFKNLYDTLAPKAGAAKISLEHFVDIARGNEFSEYKNQPWARESTLKNIEQVLKSGISVKGGTSDGPNNSELNNNKTDSPSRTIDDNQKSKTVPDKSTSAAVNKVKKEATPDTSAFNQELFNAIEEFSNVVEKAFKSMRSGKINEDTLDDQTVAAIQQFLNKFKFNNPQRVDDYLYEKSDDMGTWDSKKIYNKLSQQLSSKDPSWTKIQNKDVATRQNNTAAITSEIEAQENLNKVEAQNPPAKDESSVHNTNTNAIEKEAQTQEQLAEKIKQTQALIKNQQAWLNTLDPYLNDANYQTSGKKAATNQLRDATNALIDYRRHPEEYDDFDSYARQKKTVNWNRAHKEAQRQGVADSVLQRYDTDAKYDYEESLQALQKERDYRAQSLQEHQKELQVLQQQLDAQNKINAVKTQEPPVVDDTPKLQNENTVLDEQNAKLKENIALKGQTKDVGTGGTKTTSDTITPVQPIPAGTVSTEATELESVRVKIEEVVAAINTKTAAFTAESAEVQRVVGVENIALNSLKENIETVTTAVKNKTQAFTAEGAEVQRVVDAEINALNNLEQKKINSSVGNNAAPESVQTQPISVTSTEVVELEAIKTKLIEVTNAVNTKTQAFLAEQKAVKSVAQSEVHAMGQVGKSVNAVRVALGNVNTLLNNIKNNRDFSTGLSNININVNHKNDTNAKLESTGNIPAQTNVGNVLATEDTLGAIRTAVEAINKKVVEGTKAKTSDGDSNKKTNVGKKNAESYDNSRYFPEKLKTQTMQLAKFRAQLMTTGKLTDDIDAQIYELLDGLKQVQNGPDFSTWMQKFQQLKTLVGITDIFDKAESTEAAASYEQLIEFQKTRNKLELQYEKAEDGSALKQFYAEQLAQMDSVIAKQQEMIDNEEYEAKLAKIREEQARKLGELEAKVADKDAKKSAAKAKRTAQREAMLGKTNNAIGRAENTWMNAAGIEGDLPADFNVKIDGYYNKLEALRKKYLELKDSDAISEKDKQDIITQTMNVNKLTDEFGELVSEYQKLSGDNAKVIGTNTLGTGAGLGDYERQLKQAVATATDGKAQIKNFDATTKTLTYTVKTGKNEFTEYTAAVRRLDGQLVSVQGTTKRTETFFEATARKMKELTSYFSGMAIFSRISQELRRGIQYVREIDLALTELKKVTDETEESYDRFLETAAETGAKLGTTISAVTEATATFAKLGYSMEQATKMAESAIVYKNVGDNIASTEDAANSIISTMKGFRLEASESMVIVDRFNEVGNRFAITSQGIGEALRLSASALSEGGNSLDESIGLITAANEVVNDPSSVGTALKTLTLRLRGSKTELEEMGEDVSDMATTTSQLQAKLLALTGGQVDIMLDTNTFKNSTQILREIAEAWEDMNDIQRASALELMGGKRQANVLSALIQNFDTVEKVIETSEDSAGSALKENERYLDSIQGKIDQFNNALQAMWSDALDSDMVKGFVEFGTILIKIIDEIGLLNSALIALATYSMIKNKMGPLEFFTNIFDMLKQAPGKIKDFVKTFVSIPTAASASARAMNGLTVASFQQSLATAGVAESNQAALLSQMGLTEANAAHIIGQQTLNAQTLAQAVNNGTLTATQAAQLASVYGLTGATAGLTAAQMSQTLITAGVSREQRVAIIQSLGLGAATKQLTADEVMNTLTTTGMSQADATAIAAKLGLTVANKGLAASFKALWAAMWPVLAVMGAIAAAYGVFKLFDAMITTTEELQEELDGMKSELSDVRAELDSVNQELETTNDRMTELLAKDTLSFVEQEELDRLKESNAELERRKAILEAQEKYERERVGRQAAEIVNNERGAIGWWMNGDTVEEEVYTDIEEYLDVKKRINEVEKVLATDGISSASRTMFNTQLEDLKKELDEERTDVTEYIDTLTEALSGVEYGDSKESDKALDYYHNLMGRWNVEQGVPNAKSNEIKRIINKKEFSSEKTYIEQYVEALKNGDKDAAKSIESVIKNNSKLVADIEASGVSIQDAIDYFTTNASSADYTTLEGKTKEIAEATSRLSELLHEGESRGVGSGDFVGPLTKQQQEFAKFFDKEGNVLSEKIAEYFGGKDGGISPETQATIERIVQQVHDGQLSVEQAMKSFNAYGMVESWKIVEAQVSELNTEVFKGLGDEISGVIDTVKELSSAFESVASSIDLVSQAEAEMAYSGHLSIETALQLMESTDDWNSVLKIEEGNIKLVNGAEQALVQTKLDLIKKNLQTALSTVEAQLAQISATEASADMAYTIEESTNLAVTQLAGNMAYLTEMMTAYTKAAAGEKVDMSAVTEAAEAAKNKVLDATNYKKNTAEKIGREDLEKERDRLKTMIGIVETGDTRAEFEDNYFADKVSGGNKTKENVKDDAFQREMDYWENRLSANQARADRLENTIDLLEQKGMKASAQYYRDQMTLLNSVDPNDGVDSKLELLNGKLAAVVSRLNETTEGSEEWWEAAQEYNDIVNEIQEIESAIVDMQDAIAEIDTYKFEEFNTRLDNLVSKLGTIRDLIAPDESDWFDDQGEWTESGVAVLGAYVQELELYKQGLEETETELNKYNKAYSDNTKAYYEGLGIHSEQEYYEKTQELTEQQYDYAESINDTKQSVVDMYESNIDAIEEYTETLIDSYNDYIDSVKEALSAEKDLYEFKKNVQKQSEDINELERKISALSGSTNKSEIAERRKLEQSLYEARESLNDTYYDHVQNSQDAALDAEQSAYEETMNKFIEGMRTSLETATQDMNTFLGDVTTMVSLNAGTILEQYRQTELPLDDALTSPWEAAKEAVGNYSGDALELMNTWTQNGFLTDFPNTVQNSLESPWKAGQTAVGAFKTSVDTQMQNVVSAIKTNVKNASTKLSELYKQIEDTENRAANVNIDPSTDSDGDGGGDQTAPVGAGAILGATVALRGLMKTSKEMILGSKSFVDANTETINGVKYYRDSKTGYYYKISDLNSRRKYDGGRTTGWAIPKGTWFYTKHAKGTTGTTRDQWAITDEPQFGDELTMYATPEGTLSFMRAGSTVIPADLTRELIDLPKVVDGLINRPKFDSGINMIANAINKPEIVIDMENFLKVDRVDKDTLPQLEAMMDKKIDTFAKQLNYSIKKFAR